MNSGSLGVLGGTFNPVHFGHLRFAQELTELLGLEQTRLIPAGQPWHRDAPKVSALHRLEMVRIAVAGNPRFAIDDRECRQPTPSYTVDTLRALRVELGAERAFFLLMGADAFMALTTWKDWQRLFELTHIVVAHRPGIDFDMVEQSLPPALQAEYRSRVTRDVASLREKSAGHIVPILTTALEISATAIRKLIASGRSPRYLLPDAVIDYIRQHQLYGSLNEG